MGGWLRNMAKGRGKNAALRMAVDALMSACLVAVMATALVQEAPHEYLGVALVALVALHLAMNRRWVARLFRGRYDAVHVLQVASAAGLGLCLVSQVASALVLSKHALWFLPSLPGASWARSVHMLCSHWMFALAFAHAGLQLQGALARIGRRRIPAGALWALRVAWGAVAAFGALSFVQLGMGDYLLGRVQFAAADYGAPIVLSLARYASIATLIAGAFHYLALALRRKRRPHGRADHAR